MGRYLFRVSRVLAAVLLWTVLVSLCWVLLLAVVDPPVTRVMVGQAHQMGGVRRVQVPFSAIHRSLPLAVIASEDQRFMFHNGFAWEAIEKAREANRKGRRLRGASTISQQTAKNVFLWPERSWLRKGLEAWFTLLIETFWSKRRILEVYLNVAEMGRGVFGAEAAAQHCFGRPAAKLTTEQSALIATTLPSPRRYDCRRPGPYLRGRQQWVLRQMRNIGDVLDPVVIQRRKEKLEKSGK
jgi:monofunctional biosynthetic peptidoglycan transglycosylase